MIIDSFEDVVRYLNGSYTVKQDYQKLIDPILHLEREKYLLSLLNSPENDFSIIHVAGSKGKGTTASYIAGLLRGKTDKIGLYLSPHVYSYKERWSYLDFFPNGITHFSDEAYIECARTIEKELHDHTKLTDIIGNIPPTPFELYTLFAAVLFRQENIKLAVFETGIGGRCDATNVFKTKASVITHIEKEHTEILGASIEEIAREKCGIIKNSVPVFTTSQDEHVLAVIKKEAKAKKADLTVVEQDAKTKRLAKSYLISSPRGIEDFSLALYTAKHVSKTQYLSPVSDIALPAHGELIIDEDCAFILNGAHTKDSIADAIKNITYVIKNANYTIYKKDMDLFESESASLKEVFDAFKDKKGLSSAIAIFGCAKDKDVDGMAEELLSHFKTIYVTELRDKSKTMPITDMLLAFEKASNKIDKVKTTSIIPMDSLDDCINLIHLRRSKSFPQYVAILGSFYLCGEMREESTLMTLPGLHHNGL